MEQQEVLKSDYLHHFHINNTMSEFVKSVADFFKTHWFKNSSDVVVSTYSKAVQNFRNKIREAGDKHGIDYPFISIDVGMDFEPDPQAGRFLHQYPNFGYKFASKLYNPLIYKDDNIEIAPCWNRYKGRFEITVFCSSIYEYMDYRMMTFQWWGGLERIITPVNVEGYIILPDDVVTYMHDNKYTEQKYSLDWDASEADIYLVKNINKHKMCFPFKVIPQLKLTSVSDASDKYGGTDDDVSEHKLLIEFEWECYLPSHIVISDRNYPNFCPTDRQLILDLSVAFKYLPTRAIDQGMNHPGVTYEQVPDDLHIISTKGDGTVNSVYVEFQKSYNYFVTQEDINSAAVNTDITINLMDIVENCLYLRVYAKYGQMRSAFDYDLLNSLTLRIRSTVIDQLDVGDCIILAYYSPPE